MAASNAGRVNVLAARVAVHLPQRPPRGGTRADNVDPRAALSLSRRPSLGSAVYSVPNCRRSQSLRTAIRLGKLCCGGRRAQIRRSSRRRPLALSNASGPEKVGEHTENDEHDHPATARSAALGGLAPYWLTSPR